MCKLELTTSTWGNLKQRLELKSSDFTETINGDSTVIVFDDLSSASDVFKKIADDNQHPDNPCFDRNCHHEHQRRIGVAENE